MGSHTTTDVLIIGAGFSGLGMGIKLAEAGRDDFVILEKAADVGGTWRDNSYPGCACDIPSHLYSFSYEQNPDWTRNYSPAREIWDYLRRVTRSYRLDDHIRFGAEVASSRWDDHEQTWHVVTTTGDEFTARVLVSGVGALHVPLIPRLAGLGRFGGPTFHSATWDHDVDLRGKRVAVVGTGASAIQFVPRIADEVAELHLFQRTAPWVMPKADGPVPDWARRLFRRAPAAQRAYRHAIYWMQEAQALGFNGHPRLLRLAERMARRHLERQVRDPALREKLVPDYTIGCKRILLSNDYYPTLNREHVHLVDRGVTEVTERGIVTADGTEVEVDVIIFGTGFHVVDGFEHLDIEGRDGRNLAKQFAEQGVETYLGITVNGFPNLFLLLGPNTGLGHNSVVFMIEQQAKYVARCLDLIDRHGAVTMEVREAAQRAFNADIQHRLRTGIWTTGGCVSWYLDAQGVNRAIWPGFTWRYWWATRTVEAADYQLTGRRARSATPIATQHQP